MAAAAPEQPAPPESPGLQGDMWIWGFTGVVILAVLAVVLWRRRSGEAPAPSAESADPAATPVEALPVAFGPEAPHIVAEGGAEEAAEEEPVRAIPPDSTEWMEGEVLETEGLPERPLRPVAALMDVLRGGDALACADAVSELVRHGQAAVPSLEQALKDEDPDVRVDAAKALAAIRDNEA